jgi:hypothetical protein
LSSNGLGVAGGYFNRLGGKTTAQGCAACGAEGLKMARFLPADLHRRREEEIKRLYPADSYSTTINVFFEMVLSGLTSFYE